MHTVTFATRHRMSKRCAMLAFEKRRRNLFSIVQNNNNFRQKMLFRYQFFFQYIIYLKLWHPIFLISYHFRCNNPSTRWNTLSVTRDRKWSLFQLSTKISQKVRAPTGSQQQQEPNQMAVDATPPHADGPVETCTCTTYMQNCLLTYSDACT